VKVHFACSFIGVVIARDLRVSSARGHMASNFITICVFWQIV
jgi:hypothetical protein